MMSVIDIDFDQDENTIPAVAKLIKAADNKDNSLAPKDNDDRDDSEFEGLTADDEQRFGKRPNSIYVHYITLTKQGKFAARHYWCHKAPTQDPNWRHGDDQSVPHKWGDIRPREVKPIVQDVLTGNYSGHFEEVDSGETIFDVNWRWISWIVVVFDHQAWKFMQSGLTFQTAEADDSFFSQKRMRVDIGKSYNPTAIALSNFMRKNDQGDPMGVRDSRLHKFDLVLSVKLEGGGRIVVKVDPTGTNDGPTGGGEEP